VKNLCRIYSFHLSDGYTLRFVVANPEFPMEEVEKLSLSLVHRAYKPFLRNFWREYKRDEVDLFYEDVEIY
jgi:hypothetical protein